MKKTIIFILLLFLSLACITTSPSTSFDERVNTQVALAFTATALDEIIKSGTDIPIPTEAPAFSPSPSATLLPGDPKESLGLPSWEDELSNGKNWSLEGIEKVFGDTKFFIEDGKLVTKSETTSEGYVWWLNYRRFKDAYLEAQFTVDTCSGNDQYGLVFRSVDYESGYAYYFVNTCDGKYDLRRRTESESVMLLGMPASDQINSGSNQTNTLGVWIKNDTIRLYINGQLLDEVVDKELPNEGHFGLFINAIKTPGLTIKMDNTSYWLLD